MPLPPKRFFTLPEIAKRWGVSVRDLDLYGYDVWPVFSKRRCQGTGSAWAQGMRSSIWLAG